MRLSDLQLSFSNCLLLSSLPPYRLTIKKEMFGILLINMNVKISLIMGRRLVIKRLNDNTIDLKVMTGEATGKHVHLPRVTLCPSDTALLFKICRREFPVRVTLAVTVNKSQGQTLDRLTLCQTQPACGCAQLYVAMLSEII